MTKFCKLSNIVKTWYNLHLKKAKILGIPNNLYQVCQIMSFLDSFLGRSRTNKTNGGCLAPSSQTVGLLRRIPQLPKPSKKMDSIKSQFYEPFYYLPNMQYRKWLLRYKHFSKLSEAKKLREITLSLLCLHLYSLPLSPTPSLSLTFPVPFSQPMSFSPFFFSLSLECRIKQLFDIVYV